MENVINKIKETANKAKEKLKKFSRIPKKMGHVEYW